MNAARRSSPAEAWMDGFQQNTSAQSYPENIDAYRTVRFAEEERLRPRGEVLFCQVRLLAESDERLVSRLSSRRAPWREEASSMDTALDPAALRSVLRHLTPRHRQVLILYYRRGMTQRALAQHYGVSAQRMSQLMQAALHHARKLLVPKNQKVSRTHL
jgi:RNA polymerase sigma factor (sigma-70 family)